MPDARLQRFELRYAKDADAHLLGEALARTVFEAGWALSELSLRRETLEGIFVRLTQEEAA